ncbi:MAG TPA: hypothetical protein VGR82_17750 [Methylomirabilota bacterium]|nr:hypothetical protein [Methylomirabilota bacterium]
MPFIMGACVRCRRLMQYHAHQWELPGAGDRKTLERLLRDGRVACDRCGEPLEGDWTRDYALLELEARALSTAAAIALNARPTSRSKVIQTIDHIEANVAHNNAVRARELARAARRLVRELTFMFDTDAAGRPLN